MNKLELKDLITIGIFAAVYFVVYTALTMIAIIPIFILIVPAIAAVILGIPTMLFCVKVPKFGAFTLYGAIIGLLNILLGMSWPLLACALAFGLLGDFIMLSGKYKSFVRTLISYVLFGFWSLPVLLPIWLSTEEYASLLAEGYGTSYAESILSLATGWSFFGAVAGIVICGMIGGLLGRAVLKKHFIKAGIV